MKKLSLTLLAATCLTSTVFANTNPMGSGAMQHAQGNAASQTQQRGPVADLNKIKADLSAITCTSCTAEEQSALAEAQATVDQMIQRAKQMQQSRASGQMNRGQRGGGQMGGGHQVNMSSGDHSNMMMSAPAATDDAPASTTTDDTADTTDTTSDTATDTTTGDTTSSDATV